MEDYSPKSKKIRIDRTHGAKIPFLWESIGIYDDMTKIQIVLGSEGEFKPSLRIHPTHDKTSVIPIKVNDLVLKMFDDSKDVSVSLFVIREIERFRNTATVELIERSEFKNDVNSKQIEEEFVSKIKNKKHRDSLKYIMPLALLKLKKKERAILFSQREDNGNNRNVDRANK